VEIKGSHIAILAGSTLAIVGAAYFLKKKKIRNYYGGNELLTDPKITQGIRNNNPLNIVRTKNLWANEIPIEKSTNKKFKQFYTFIDGIVAAIVNLRFYSKAGFNTIEKIIYKWAPPSDGNTPENYINHIVSETKIKRNEIIDVKDKNTMFLLIKTMSKHESGTKHLITEKMFDKAWREAK